jgi:esterase/lipase superfamily enzyme
LRAPDERLPYFGDDVYFTAHDPMHLVQARPELAKSLQLWLDIGEEDESHSSVAELRSVLQHLGIAHVWRVFTGEHDGDYWSRHAAEYLRFYARSVRLPITGGATAQM